MSYTATQYSEWLFKRVDGLPDNRKAIAIHGNDVLTGALTLIGEIRNGTLDAKVAVAHSFHNRHLQKPEHSIAELCLAPWQYSCWIPQGGVQNNAYLMSVVSAVVAALDSGKVIGPQAFPHLYECMYLVEGVLNGALTDTIEGATHYYVAGTKTPKWAEGRQPCATFGTHLFFNHIKW